MVATVDARLLFAERESYRIMSLAEEFLKRLEQDRTEARQRSMGAKIPELPCASSMAPEFAYQSSWKLSTPTSDVNLT
jgi:hypothetical protein